MQGIVSGILKYKFHVCMGCGEDHDEDLQSLASTAPAREAEEAVLAPPEPTEAEYKARLVEYQLNEIETDGMKRLVCKNCGAPSVSLADRMLREPGPGGCPGCQHHTKWG
jgi:hypothetical protein